MRRLIFGVMPVEEFERRRFLFDAIAEVLPVSFQPTQPNAFNTEIAGAIILDGNQQAAALALQTGIPVFMIESRKGAVGDRRSSAVELRSGPKVDPCLRNQRLADTKVGSFSPISPAPNQEIVGLIEGQPFWVRHSSGRVLLDRVSLELPVLASDEPLCTCFQASSFVHLLPLLQFLKNVVAEEDWDPGPNRACFVFDDPNLAQPRFGYLDFHELIRHAQLHGYHAAVATVPLDAARSSSAIVRLFRENAQNVSLLFHGNNHIKHELFRNNPVEARQALLAQACRRIQEFERHHGLTVDRIMEAPHAVFSHDVFSTLASLGFESALVTPQLLLDCQRHIRWPGHFGMDMADIMPGGFATIPRIKMGANWKTGVVLAGFLRQPMVIAGHHQDAAEGLDFLAEFAQLAGGFGPVHWLSVGGIARTNYKSRRRNSHLTIRTYQRRVTIAIPDGVDSITIERAWLKPGESEMLRFGEPDCEPILEGMMGCSSQAIALTPGMKQGQLLSTTPFRLNPDDVPAPPRSFWPVARRFLSLGRDRAYQSLHPRRRLKAPGIPLKA